LTVTPEQLEEFYGKDYPNSVTCEGVPMRLEREGRFSRTYVSADGRSSTKISRFMDRSATITFADLREEWPSWSEHERDAFCGASAWLADQRDFVDMLRFLMHSTNAKQHSILVSLIGQYVPQQEAFDFLFRLLQQPSGYPSANITQAIAITKHPEAEGVIRAHFTELWADATLWDDAPFTNWRAFDATCCIAHLLELGVPSREFEEKVGALAQHSCKGNRDSCSTFLHTYFDWLPAPNPPRFGA
jgi:hypothetical protein